MRAITSGELAVLRGPHWAKVYAIIDRPVVVGACRVNQTFSVFSGITELAVDSWTTGSYAALNPGMTILVGTGSGLADVGRCRLLVANSAESLTIGMTSDIEWVDNLYLTIVDEYGWWAKPMMLTGEDDAFAEGVLEYTDEHENFDPVVLMGPDAVLWLTGETVSYNPSSAASWVLDGTIIGIAWACSGSTVTNGTTATPTVTFNAAGRYNLTCTLTTSGGKTWTGRRNVYVVSAENPPDEIIVSSCFGDGDAGGWEATCAVLTDTLQGLLRGGLKCILFTENYIPGVSVAWDISNPGETAGTANILMAGWIDGESIRYTDDRREVEFQVKGPQHWLGKITGNAVTLKDLTTDLTQTWLTIDGMTIRHVLWHWMHWRCTADMIIDVNVEALAQPVDFSNNSNGSVWEQLGSIAQVMLMRVGCNRYGQFFAEREPQWILSGDRGGITTLMTITDQDWIADGVSIQSDMVTKYSMIDLSAKTYDGTAAVNVYSRAPGISASRYGGIAQVDGIYVADQSEANAIAALLFAHLNNPFESITLELMHDNRFFDIVPMAYATLSIPARAWGGAAFEELDVIPRRVEQVIDGSKITTNLELEGVTSEIGYPEGVVVLPPSVTPNPGGEPGDGEGVIEPPPTTWFPPTTSPGPTGDCGELTVSGPFTLTWDKAFLDSNEEAFAWLPCKVKGGTVYSYVLDVPGGGACVLSAVDDNKQVVLTANSSGQFDPVSPTNVAGFKIKAPEIIVPYPGYDPGAGKLYPNELIFSGVCTVDHFEGGPEGRIALEGLTPGDWYCVDWLGGPYQRGAKGDEPPYTPVNVYVAGVWGYSQFTANPFGYGGRDMYAGTWIDVEYSSTFLNLERLDGVRARQYFQALPPGSTSGGETPTLRLGTINTYGSWAQGQMSYRVYTTSLVMPPKYLIPTWASSLWNVCPHD